MSEFNADFSQEPSWLKKQSLSSLSSTENLDMPSRADSSGNWLLGPNAVKAESEEAKDDSGLSGLTQKLSKLNCEEKDEHVFKIPTIEANFKINESKLQEPAEVEVSELPSLYWKPTESDQSKAEIAEEVNSQCQSYVTGNIEVISLQSDVGCSSQGSTSPASTVRENTDLPHCDSIIPEPQLSSTREITDDGIDLGVSSNPKRVTFHPDLSDVYDTLPAVPDMQSVPNLCSTEKNWSVKEQKSFREAMERSGLSPEQLLALFSDTSSVATPILMEKVKEFFNPRTSDHSAPDPVQPVPAVPVPAVPVPAVPVPAVPVPAVEPVRTEENPSALNIRRRSLMKSRHTLATVSHSHSTPAPSRVAHNDFVRVTATVKKKMAPQPKPMANMATIKTNKTSIYFGSSKQSKDRNKNAHEFSIVNISRSTVFLVELRFSDTQSDDFKLVDADGSLVSQMSFPLDPSEKRTVKLTFLTRRKGPIQSTLNIYPRSELTKHLKYSIALSGYGGSSLIHTLIDNPERILVPLAASAHWTCRFSLENQGTVTAFTCIQPVTGTSKKIKFVNFVVFKDQILGFYFNFYHFNVESL